LVKFGEPKDKQTKLGFEKSPTPQTRRKKEEKLK
jgi:hypothetical protein